MTAGIDSPKGYIAVVGSINIDICGKAFAPLIACDSNPGTVSVSMGGVGGNIAHNLRLLGSDIMMFTAIGSDVYAQLIDDTCAQLGIDLSHTVRVEGAATPTYLCIDGPEGDMALAVCDCALASRVSPEYIERQLPLLNRAAAVVFETNLPAETIEHLARHCTAPLFADPVSVTKAEKLRPVIGRLHTLKPNLIEAELLSGVQIRDGASLDAAADRLIETGLERVFISRGADGVYCRDRERRLRLPCPPTSLVNATGGGDAMMAALALAYARGMEMEASARLALAAGSLAVEAQETINPQLSLKAVLRRAQID